MSRFRGRKWWAAVVVPALMLGVTVALATPAAAAVGTVTVDSDSQPNVGGDGVETVTAECPANAALIGAGWSVNARVIADEVVPDVVAGTVRVEGRIPDGGPAFANWSVTAKAICATGVTNVVRAQGPSGYDSSSPKNAVATCPFGKKVVGIGYQIGTFAPGQVHVTSVVPTADTVTVTAYEDDNGAVDAAGNNVDWDVTAYAVCATEPFGLERVASPSPAQGTDHTTCPTGKKVLGSAGSLNSAQRDVSISSTQISTYAGFEIASANGVEDRSGANAAWSMSTTAICAFA